MAARVAAVAASTAAWIPNTKVPANEQEPHTRDSILLVGDVRLHRVLELIAAPRVLVAMHPLEAVSIVEREAAALHTVVVSTELDWANELRELLAADHPTIRVLAIAPTR